MANFHFESWTATFSGLARVRACGGGGSGIYGQTTPYRGGGGGGGAFSELIASVTLGHVYTVLVPDKTDPLTVGPGSEAVFDSGTSSPLHCVAAGGKQPGFFGPIGAGGAVVDCIGTTKIAGNDGDGPAPDFSAGGGHTGGSSGDPSGLGVGGLSNSDGNAPGGGGGGGSSAGAGGGGPNNNEGRGAEGYVSVQQISFPYTLAAFGTPPPRPTGRRSKYGYVMAA